MHENLSFCAWFIVMSVTQWTHARHADATRMLNLHQFIDRNILQKSWYQQILQ